jgi:carboxypeptidase C (cathepsin A)
MLYLSQPVGVGFSYSAEGIGLLDSYSGDVYPPDATSIPPAAAFGRWPVINASAVGTTELAAIAAYHTIQALFYNLPQFDCEIKSRSFNLWTESYGGHYGPVFYDYFYEQNQAIANGSVEGVLLNFDSLGIGNGLIDYAIQGTSRNQPHSIVKRLTSTAPSYPKFAVENTYGLRTINQTVQDYMTFALTMEFGCLDQILNYCRPYLALPSPSTPSIKSICQEAADMCNDNVLGTDCPSTPPTPFEQITNQPYPNPGPWESYSNLCLYDIRSKNCALNPSTMEKYLNRPLIQNALGVNLNYTYENNAVFLAFQASGDWVSQSALSALERLLDNGVRVALYYG